MISKRIFIFIPGLLIAVILIHCIEQSEKISSLYNGVSFLPTPTVFLVNFYMFAIYSLFIFSEFEKYIHSYGHFIVIRTKRRSVLYRILFGRLIKSLLLIESMKILFYFAICYLKYDNVVVDGALTMKATLYIITITILLFIQMNIEIFYSSKIAIIAILSLYLGGVTLGSYISMFVEGTSAKNILNVFILQNYMMYNRYKILIQELNLNIIILIGILIMIFTIFCLIVNRRFKKIDII